MKWFECGLELDEAAASASKVFQSGMDPLASLPYSSMADFQKQSWQKVVRRAIHLCDTDSLAAAELARELYNASFGTEIPVVRWEQLPALHRTCWDAVGRHLATLSDWEDVQDLEALEASWPLWITKRTVRETP